MPCILHFLRDKPSALDDHLEFTYTELSKESCTQTSKSAHFTSVLHFLIIIQETDLLVGLIEDIAYGRHRIGN